jgi:hypothetical protein
MRKYVLLLTLSIILVFAQNGIALAEVQVVQPAAQSKSILTDGIQTNTLWMHHSWETTWTLHEGSGNRDFYKFVTFPKTFSATPKVILSMVRIDCPDRTWLCLDVEPTQITPQGFYIHVSTWSSCSVYGIKITWVAYN